MTTTASTSTPPGTPEWRAGATDLTERRRLGISRGALADIPTSAATTSITWTANGAARIGASVTIATLAADARLAAAYPALAQTAAGLATPQIRHLATLGGNLAQRTRCWYYRHPHIACLKKGGTTCPARDGNHLYGVAFDLGPCVAPHPSSMAAACLASDATITTDRRAGLSIGDALGDGSNGAADNALQPGELITAVELPIALAGERAFYKRAIGRTHAEWPLVELVARVGMVGGVVQHIRLAAGGIAPVPLRLTSSEQALQGQPLSPETIRLAALRSRDGATPLSMTGYKLDLLAGLVQDLLEQCAH